MEVSVIIVTYNSASCIEACLDSLFKLTHLSFEIIVCDNASTDGTQELIHATYSSVVLVESTTNLGFAAANNRGVERATGRYLAFLNPDTVVEDGWLYPLLNALESDSSIGAVTPMLVFSNDPDRINACGNDIHLSGITYCKDYGRSRYEAEPFEVGAISGAAFVMQRELFLSLGGFEEHLFLYYEDTDLSIRLRLAGLRCCVVPESKVQHDYRGAFSPQKVYYLERNRFLSLFSLMKRTDLLLMFPSLLMVEGLSWGYCILQGRKALAAKTSSWRAVVQDLDWLISRRRRYAVPSNKSALDALTHKLKIQYVGATSRGITLLLDSVAWLAGVPFWIWRIYNKCAKRK